VHADRDGIDLTFAQLDAAAAAEAGGKDEDI
jgi:hypothetical protein